MPSNWSTKSVRNTFIPQTNLFLMPYSTHVDNPDVVLIGSGVMSSNLGAMLKKLSPDLSIQMYEVTNELAQESSNGWNNAGTGHAGICELSYTPHREPDGSVKVDNALKIFEQFEHTKQFWAYAVASGMIDTPSDFINPVPHISFVHGQEQVEFLTARHQGMAAHHFFSDMEFSTDPGAIRQWAPLLIEGRGDVPVAATKMDSGTDVNFGALSRKLAGWLAKQPKCGVATGHRVCGLHRERGLWHLTIRDAKTGNYRKCTTKFVFVGAGGGSLQLLQKSGIPESKGFGGFPVGGQWLVCSDPKLVARHQAKVYGQAQAEAPTMAVPHLDTRVLDGRKYLLFGPFAAWTTKFLHRGGSFMDLPGSVRLHNIGSLVKVGYHNIPLIRYLVKEGLQSMASRMEVLHGFYPEARQADWKLVDAGIRVQSIKKEDGEAGIVHYGTEVVTDKDCSISALLGASPGASVSVYVMLEVIRKCFSHLLETDDGHARMKEMLPNFDEDLKDPSMANRYRELSDSAERTLNLKP